MNVFEPEQKIYKTRQIDRQIGSYVERQVDRQIGSYIDGQIGSYIDRQIDRQIGSYIDGQIDKQIDRQLHRWIDRQAVTQMDRLIDRQVVTLERQIDKQLDSFGGLTSIKFFSRSEKVKLCPKKIFYCLNFLFPRSNIFKIIYIIYRYVYVE